MSRDRKQKCRIRLLEQAKTEKGNCPRCRSSHKVIDMKENGQEASCECEKCCKRWAIKLGD